jgi:hypothetical protein
MGKPQKPSKYSVALADLERSVQVPVADQGTVQPMDPHPLPISEDELQRQRLLGIEHAG